MEQAVAKVRIKGKRSHTGTAWLFSRRYVMTASHCVGDRKSRLLTEEQIILQFPWGKIPAEIKCCDFDLDVAILSVQPETIPKEVQVIRLGKLTGWLPGQRTLKWFAYGFPSAHKEGLQLDGTIATLYGSVDDVRAIQLTCDIGGLNNLDGVSGAAVCCGDVAIGVIRYGPPRLKQRVIHATPVDLVAEKFTEVAETLAQRGGQLGGSLTPYGEEIILKQLPSIPNIFIHFFNDEILRLYDIPARYEFNYLADILTSCVKIAFLLTDKRLIFPTIDLVQSRFLPAILSKIQGILSTGDVFFCGAETIPQKLLGHKRKHFDSVRLYPGYFERDAEELLERTSRNWVKRIQNTTRDIAEGWKESISRIDTAGQNQTRVNLNDRLLLNAYSSIDKRISLSRYFEQLYRIPERLDGQAFMWDIVVAQQLVSFASNKELEFLLKIAINFQWLSSYLNEYGAALLTSIPGIGDIDCGVARYRADMGLNFNVFIKILRDYRLLELLKQLKDNESLIALKQSELFHHFKKKIVLVRYSAEVFGNQEVTQLIRKERRTKQSIDKILGSQKEPSQAIWDILEMLVEEAYMQGQF